MHPPDEPSLYIAKDTASVTNFLAYSNDIFS